MRQLNEEELEHGEYFRSLLTKANLSTVVKTVSQDLHTPLVGSQVLLCELLSSKVVSEIASNSWEKNMSIHFGKLIGQAVQAAKSDNDPDLVFPGNRKLEIKVTSGEAWRGGAFSKRESWYLLVAREPKDHQKALIVLAHIPEDEWVKSIPSGKDGKLKYYATNFDKKRLLEYVGEGKAHVISGAVYEKMKKDGTPYKRKQIKVEKHLT